MPDGVDKHDERCPFCGRFIKQNADGYYDREDRTDELSQVVCFCVKDCADKFHANKNAFACAAVARKAIAEFIT